jgi:protein-S-isoprenylcysteine O-methyltransferase Ste14
VIFIGGLLHVLVVVLPLACLGLIGSSLRDPATLVFVAGASAFYAGDAVTMQWISPESQSPLNTRARRWAAVTGVLLLLLFWACLVERGLSAPAGSWLQVLGGALLLLGITLRALAVRTLGRRFRTEIEVEAGLLVRHGVYRFLRHPSETGLLAAALGAAILLQSTVGLVIWCIALIPVTLVRLSLEEHALEEYFGEKYRSYTEEVGAVLPLVTRGL